MRCVYCGVLAAAGDRWCPACGRELFDRDRWYIRYAPNIVGAVLGAGCGAFWVIAGLVLWPEWFDVPFVSEYVGAIVLGAALLGLVAGFFEWDSMRGADRDGFFLKLRKR